MGMIGLTEAEGIAVVFLAHGLYLVGGEGLLDETLSGGEGGTSANAVP